MRTLALWGGGGGGGGGVYTLRVGICSEPCVWKETPCMSWMEDILHHPIYLVPQELQYIGDPDPLKDPNNGTPQNYPHYYVGGTRGIIGSFLFLDPLGGLGISGGARIPPCKPL